MLFFFTAYRVHSRHILLCSSVTYVNSQLHFMGIHYTLGVNPTQISAVTFQIKMLIWGYYHRECFPRENYPEH